jgi:hypothetical protein
VTETSTALATQGQRLVASDVVWEDMFRQTTLSEMTQRNITGLTVPTSHFAEEGIDSPSFWSPVVERVNGSQSSGGNTSGKAIGTQLLGVTVLPKGTQLSSSQLNTIVDSTDLGFVVSVKNSGDVQVASIPVTLTIKQTPKPITATVTIPLINPGATQTATFKNLPQPAFVSQTTLTVDVKPVKGETNPNNNSGSYQVIFSLG